MKNSEDVFGSVYESGSVVFREGETGDAMYIVQSGAVEVSKKQGDVETVVAVLEKGDFFGEMAVLKADARSATVTAARRTRLLPLTRDALLAKIKDDTSVGLHILKGLIVRLQRANLKFRQVLMDTQSIFAEEEEPDDIFEETPSIERELREDSEKKPPRAKDKPREKTEKTEKLKKDESASFDISIEELSEIWEVEGNTARFRHGESIFSEGDSGNAMYIILKGAVEISLDSGEDKQVLDILESGAFFGEMAIIVDCVRSASATAVAPLQVMVVEREELEKTFKKSPELLMHIIQSLCFRLQRMNAILIDPKASIDIFRQSWRPLLKKTEPLKIAVISLSTCAGCSVVLLDDEILSKISQKADIVYCPMLMDEDEIPEADIALIDGVVRLKEDEEKLEEARRKSRFLISWGTCACFGGVPAEANRYELEELIEATYGNTDDAFAYYMSGKKGVREDAYRKGGMALLRKAYKLNDFVKVDYYLPGCPPSHKTLFKLLDELTGEEIKASQAAVCKQCGRKPDKTPIHSFNAFPGVERGRKCLNSLGVLCMGFLVKGDCGAVCPRNGLPCWGCRGLGKATLKKMADGYGLEEILFKALARRCKTEEELIKPSIKLIKKQSHNLFNFDPNCANHTPSVR